MGLLSKIALALAFLAAFAIPWLGATANGATDRGVVIVAGKADVAEPEAMEPGGDAPDKGGVAPGDMEEDEEFEDDLYLDEEEGPMGEPPEPGAEGAEHDRPGMHEGR